MRNLIPMFLSVAVLGGADLMAQSVQAQTRSGLNPGPAPRARVNLEEDWAVRYDHGILGHDGFQAAKTDAQGNVFAVGNSLGGGGTTWSYEVLTTKYDASGTLLWEQRFDSAGSGFDDTAVDLAVDTDGSVVVLGTGPTISSDQDVLLFRYDTAGTLLWQYTWSNNWSDGAHKVAIAPDGSIYVLAQSYYLPGYSDVVLIKFDALGNHLWERHYDGHFGTDNPKMLAIDANGDIYIGGETIMTSGTVDFDWLALKYDAAGTLQWVFERGGSINYPDYVNDMALHPSGGIVMTGYTVNRIIGWGGETDITTMYIDASGQLVWESMYSGPQGRMQAVTCDAQGNTYVTGEPSLIISYDLHGVQRWEQSFMHPTALNAIGYGVAISPQGLLFVSGRTFSFSSNTDLLLMVLDPRNGHVFGSSVYDFGSYDDTGIGSGSRCLVVGPGRVAFQAGSSANSHNSDGILRRFTF